MKMSFPNKHFWKICIKTNIYKIRNGQNIHFFERNKKGIQKKSFCMLDPFPQIYTFHILKQSNL